MVTAQSHEGEALERSFLPLAELESFGSSSSKQLSEMLYTCKLSATYLIYLQSSTCWSVFCERISLKQDGMKRRKTANIECIDSIMSSATVLLLLLLLLNHVRMTVTDRDDDIYAMSGNANCANYMS